MNRDNIVVAQDKKPDRSKFFTYFISVYFNMAPSAITDLLPVSGPLTSKSVAPEKEQHVHGMENKSPLAAISHGDVMLPGVPMFTDMEKKRQWQLEHMAAAFRHWAREGYVEGISGHISVRDPEHHDIFWTNRTLTLFEWCLPCNDCLARDDGLSFLVEMMKPY